MVFVVFLSLLLDRYVCKVHEDVVQICGRRRILRCTESCKPLRMQICSQRVVIRDQHIDSKIELSTTDQERMVDVPRNDVLVPSGSFPVLHCPLLDLRQLADEKDANTLALRARFHDPGRFSLLSLYSPELLDKERIVVWKHKCDRHDIINFVPSSRSLHLLPVLLDVLHDKIFACQLIVVGIVVDHLVFAKPHHEGRQMGSFACPVQIPVFILVVHDLPPSSPLEI
mmetsp:Transcript_12694/g.29251  ORF Transcript_12694/g.29251 Transcript_12694/m.29251 type:complete len:227 (-) Transcript_12694:362-1042(-)